ncbi:MAG TPA: AMP-binding protein, partial [Rhizobiaceae bacterium]|nr:AMP-binding protein [Rhizobiaceae bacterium]
EAVARAVRPPFAATIWELLAAGVAAEPQRVVLIVDGAPLTMQDLAIRAMAAATAITGAGVPPGGRVLAMLGNGIDHIALFLGAALAGAVFVPVNPDLRGPSLAHVLAKTAPDTAFVTADAAARLAETGCAVAPDRIVTCERWGDRFATSTDTERRQHRDWPLPGQNAAPDDLRAFLFTSGTTGPPKGVMVTERMLLASAAGTALASDCKNGDIFLMWEPIHHIGGCQIAVMALMHAVALVLVERFSASRLWDTVRRHGITKLHYLGGVLEILLKAEPKPDDRDHPVKLAFGGGCRPQVWRAFQQRFDIPIREVYGMTEASSFTTVNVDGVVGSVGTPVPWFDVALLDADATPVADGQVGEIVVESCHPGLFTPGYLDEPEATARLLQGGRLHSGDSARREADGHYWFLGRLSDSLRRRGENISAWEVETALAAHPQIAETAVTGVDAEIGEQEILCFVLMRAGATFNAAALSHWARANLPPHHVPRYWKHVETFERTPSQRILKNRLDRSLDDAFDAAPARERA